jgi:hypothetical protein
MKKLIIIALVLGMSGCVLSMEDRITEIKRMNNSEDCYLKIGNTEIYDCPCDKYKIGDNPFKCK